MASNEREKSSKEKFIIKANYDPVTYLQPFFFFIFFFFFFFFGSEREGILKMEFLKTRKNSDFFN